MTGRWKTMGLAMILALCMSFTFFGMSTANDNDKSLQMVSGHYFGKEDQYGPHRTEKADTGLSYLYSTNDYFSGRGYDFTTMFYRLYATNMRIYEFYFASSYFPPSAYFFVLLDEKNSRGWITASCRSEYITIQLTEEKSKSLLVEFGANFEKGYSEGPGHDYFDGYSIIIREIKEDKMRYKRIDMPDEKSNPILYPMFLEVYKLSQMNNPYLNYYLRLTNVRPL
jgi:hypothetical protein